MPGIFSNDLFNGDDGLGGLSGLEPFEMSAEATDGDLALMLWNMNALQPAFVLPGPAAIMKGLRALATRRGIDPNAAVQQSGSRLMVDDRLMVELRSAQAAANSLNDTQRAQLQAQVQAARTGGAMLPQPSSLPGAADLVPLPEAGADRDRLLPGQSGGAPRWLPYALLAGGVVVAGGLVWMAARRPKAATANRRSRRRRRAA